MKRYRQFLPIVISIFEVSEWHHPIHAHNHYELIYIKKGCGIHYINKISVPYKAGDIFLLGPQEEHYFEIDNTSRFIYLKFTDLYIREGSDAMHHSVKELEYLIHSKEAHHSRFQLTAHDQLLTDQIFVLIEILRLESNLNERLIWQQIITLSIILKRNLPRIVGDTERNSDNQIQAMLAYIHENIYAPENLRSAVMAVSFNTTLNYIGTYFKRNTGISLRLYVKTYRHTLIKKRIESGNYSLKQIADEFGLTDESHVHKVLKMVPNGLLAILLPSMAIILEYFLTPNWKLCF